MATNDLRPLSGFNALITIFIFISALSLLWLASRIEGVALLSLGIVFSILLVTNYSLLHEASHHNHNRYPSLNYLLGNLNAILFPIAFTFFQSNHNFHHDNNRTKSECFEYYDPKQPLATKIFRHLQWYSLLFGTYWFFIPLVNLITATLPWLLKLWPFSVMAATQKMFNRFDNNRLRKISAETMISVFFWACVWQVLDLQLVPTLFLYCCFAFNWSTRQYIAHAFTPLDKEEGVLNLKLDRISEKLILHNNWHQVHHQHPHVPWHLLPAHASQPPQQSYYRQYLRLWSGPKPLAGFCHDTAVANTHY